MSSFFSFIQHTAPQHVLMNQLKQNIIQFNQFAEKKSSKIHPKKRQVARCIDLSRPKRLIEKKKTIVIDHNYKQ